MTAPEAQEVHLELLVGRTVVDPHGKRVGRIEEVIAARENGACYVQEFHLGAAALLERLSVVVTGVFSAGRPHRVVVPWDQMDLTDPTKPRTRKPKESLSTR